MYCQECGAYNSADKGKCVLCGAGLDGQIQAPDENILLDLNKLPIRELIRAILDTPKLVVWIFFPLLMIIYLFRRLDRSGHWFPAYRSRLAKFHPVKPEELAVTDNKKCRAVMDFLEKKGFEHLIDLEDHSRVEANIYRFYVNRSEKIYAEVFISKDKKRPALTSFTAYYPRSLLLVMNSYPLPIQHASNLTIIGLPGQKPEQIYRKFIEVDAEKTEQRLLVKSGALFRTAQKIRRHSIDQGLKQGIYKVEGAPDGRAKAARGRGPSVSPCYFHSTSVAVRNCDDCGLPLCDHCYHGWQGRYYCPHCLQEHQLGTSTGIFSAAVPERLEAPVEEVQYAGVGLRGAALALDILVIGLLTAGVGLGLYHGGRLILDNAQARVSAGLAGMIFCPLFTAYYLIVPVARSGQTIGLKLLGLHMIDYRGQTPDIRSTVVRFSYYLLSILFIFPFLGFLIIPFNKMKRGLHDKLAETYIVTKRSLVRTTAAWAIILVVLSGTGWTAFEPVKNVWNFYRIFSMEAQDEEIRLAPKWAYELTDPDDYITSSRIMDGRLIYSTNQTIKAVDLSSGRILWEKDGFNDLLPAAYEAESESPLVFESFQPEGTIELLRIDPDSGEVLWQIAAKKIDYQESNFAMDGHYLFYYDLDQVQSYDPESGRLLWQMKPGPGWEIEMIQPGQPLLLFGYREEAPQLMYISPKTGEIIREVKDKSYWPGYSFQNGYQIIRTDNKTILMYLPEQRVIWERDDFQGFVLAHMGGPLEKGDSPSILLGSQAAVNGLTGEKLYTYPPGSGYVGRTHDYIIVRQVMGDEPKDSKEVSSQLMLLEPNTGRPVASLTVNGLLQTSYLSEDETTIILGLRTFRTASDIQNMESALLLWDKKNFTHRQVLLGLNLQVEECTLLEDKQTVFMPTDNSVGVYFLNPRPSVETRQ